jgi:hypothetical protein
MSDGSLDVTFKSSSAFLGGALPLEIRDAHNRLVARSNGGTSVDVPAGLYVVEATLPGGSRHAEVVEVVAGTPTSIVLSRAKIDDADVIVIGGDILEPDAPHEVPSVELIGSEGCELRERGPKGWLFEPLGDPDAVPFATFLVGGTTVSASLPLNPRGKPDERAAIVRFEQTAIRGRADVGFVRQRRVAWTLEGLVKAGDTTSTEEIFRNADEVLFRKYRDPAAAALGGLTLHRIGRLQDRTGWVENLARDFPWIVDGIVLRAALMSTAKSQDERGRGLNLLLGVAGRRPMFSDGFALMLRLLRAWPDGSASSERRDVLTTNPVDPTTVDWDAMAITTYDEA